MSNENIFREVDEELRGDRLRKLWQQFGPWLIIAAVLVVVGVGANEGWQWWQNSNSSRSSDLFYTALESAAKGDVAGAEAALDTVIAQGSGGYPTLAKFRQAALLASSGKTAEAVAAYDALATAETNSRIRDLALVLAGYLLVDGGDVNAVNQRVGGLADPTNTMRNAAREAIGLTQYKAGDIQAAFDTFSEILADPLVTQDLAARVQVYVAQLIAQGAVPPVAADAAAATDVPAAGSTEAVTPAAEPATTTTASEPVATPAVTPAPATPTTATPAAATPAVTTTTAPVQTPAPTATAAPATTVTPTAETPASTTTATPTSEPAVTTTAPPAAN